MWLEFSVARARQTLEHQRDVVLAWHVEAIHRQKKLPPLEELLKVRRRSQTVQEQRAMLSILSQQVGSPLRTRKRKPKAK